jgi:hypothetical protein
MTDQEINEAVARKLGWKDDFDLTNKVKCWTKSEHKFETTYELPDYCHDIAAAWEIMEKLEVAVIAKLSKGWACNPNPPGFDFLVKADTAPMAICLAFLKLS